MQILVLLLITLTFHYCQKKEKKKKKRLTFHKRSKHKGTRFFFFSNWRTMVGVFLIIEVGTCDIIFHEVMGCGL